MGWLDIIPLLQKVLPLLARGVPMLEVFVASRGNAKEEIQTSLNHFSAQVREDLSANAAQQSELAEAIAVNTERVSLLSADIGRLRYTTEAQASQIAASEKQIKALASRLQLLVILCGVLLLLCIAILVLLLVHHL